MEQSLKGEGLDGGDQASKPLVQQNIDLRRKLEEEHNSYKRKLQAYQDGQQRQAQLVQKLQAKVTRLIHRQQNGRLVLFGTQTRADCMKIYVSRSSSSYTSEGSLSMILLLR